MKAILLSVSLLIAVQTSAQSLPEFSELSSRIFSNGYFSSLKLPDGYIYIGVSAVPGVGNYIYKINHEGKLSDSISLSIDGFSHSGNLLRYDGRNFFVGRSVKPFTGSYNDYFSTLRKTIFEFSDELEIIQRKTYDGIIPYGVGVSLSEQFGTPVIMAPLGYDIIVKDTLFSFSQYLFFDTLNFLPLDYYYQFEKVGIDGSIYQTKQIQNQVFGMQAGVFADDRFYIYGEATGNQGPFGEVVSEYNLNGDFVRLHSFDLPGQNYFSGVGSSKTGKRNQNFIYNAYNGGGLAAPPDCDQPEEPSALMIDKRDLTFNLIERKPVPTCGYPGGRNCFAFSADSKVYYLSQTEQGKLGLHKYDASLNLIWSEEYDFPGYHYAMGLREADDGAVIIESVQITAEGRWLWKLYKIDANGNAVSGANIPFTYAPTSYFSPNPFRNELRLTHINDNFPGDLSIEVFDLKGTQLGAYRLTDKILDLSTLQVGMYMLLIRDEQSNKPVGSQLVLKM